jgi:peptide-methionine (S)-S-oxide reductase
MKASLLSGISAGLIALSAASAQALETAVFGGGCFWCLEAAYELLPGVVDVENGYAGGSLEEPSYEELCSGETGHAEVVRIRFDPAKIGYGELLELFWKIHDPTTLDRQGADVGSQYRSLIFYTNEDQRAKAEASMKALKEKLADPVVTELLPSPRFWPAEAYHQDYFRKHPEQAYCRVVIAPKLKKAGLR